MDTIPWEHLGPFTPMIAVIVAFLVLFGLVYGFFNNALNKRIADQDEAITTAIARATEPLQAEIHELEAEVKDLRKILEQQAGRILRAQTCHSDALEALAKKDFASARNHIVKAREALST